MTDLTTDTFQKPPDARRPRSRHSKGEYLVYLSLIFLAALPFCAVIWVYLSIRHAKLPAQGPVQSAISEARTIAPCIFWA